MTSREIILANLTHANPTRPGLTFDNNRINDMSWAWASAEHYTPRRWQEGNVEYYDDEWGNLWVRMLVGPVKGEIHSPSSRTGASSTA